MQHVISKHTTAHQNNEIFMERFSDMQLKLVCYNTEVAKLINQYGHVNADSSMEGWGDGGISVHTSCCGYNDIVVRLHETTVNQ